MCEQKRTFVPADLGQFASPSTFEILTTSLHSLLARSTFPVWNGPPVSTEDNAMTDVRRTDRRRFLQTGFLGSAALAAACLPARLVAAVTKPSRDPFDGLKVGITSYSLRKFTLDQAITMTKEAGVKYISLKDVHLPLKSTPAALRDACVKIEAAGLVLMGGGVIYLNDKEDEVRAAFEYVKGAGMPTMIASPEPAALDLVERMAKQYDTRVAIHNHGPGDNRYPSPLDVFRLVKDRDGKPPFVDPVAMRVLAVPRCPATPSMRLVQRQVGHQALELEVLHGVPSPRP